MTPRRIVFWEPSVSPHKLALFRALVASGRDCVYVAQDGLPAERAAQGWAIGATDGLDIRIAPDAAAVRSLITARRDESLHLVSGLRHVPVIVAALRTAVATRARFAIMAEPRASEGWRGIVRLWQSRLTEGAIRRHAAFVLAIGGNGPRWFARAGYRPDRIFPFAYFLAPAGLPAPRREAPPTIAYLGRLTRAKGIDLFLDAVARLDRPVRIVVAGAGDGAARVAATPGIDWRGAVPMAEVPALLAGVDALVQPSRTTDDGWGAVVSEALLAGAMAAATRKVGAAILLDDPARGAVAEAADVASVTAAITRVLDSGRLTDADRAARARWAADTLTGDAGARRLLAIADHVLAGGPPPPPFPPEA